MKNDYIKEIREKKLDSWSNLYYNCKNIEDAKAQGISYEGSLEILRERKKIEMIKESGIEEAHRIMKQREIDIINANKLWKEKQTMKGLIICLNQNRLMK